MKLFQLFVLIYLVFSSSQVVALEYQETHACDEFAAHPNDPNRWAKGILDHEIIPGPAMKHCSDAVRDYPNTPRFQFQLGRALWSANRYAEGLKHFFELDAKYEYGPAYSYLGEAYMRGLGGLQIDEQLSVSLYQMAVSSGFSPANRMPAPPTGKTGSRVSPNEDKVTEAVAESSHLRSTPQISANTEVLKPSGKLFSESKFLESKIMAGLFHGNFDLVRKGKSKYIRADSALFYISGFIGPFSQNYNFLDETNSCVDLFRPVLVRDLNMKVARASPGSAILFGGNRDEAAKQGFQIFGEMLRNLAKGGGLVNNEYSRTQMKVSLLKQNGEKDAVRLIKNYGCNSETVKRIYRNLTAFVMDQPPTLSSMEKIRQEDAKAKKAHLALVKRKEILRVAASNSCNSRFKKKQFCDCLLKRLGVHELSDHDWSELGDDFKNVLNIGKKYDGILSSMKSCRQKG